MVLCLIVCGLSALTVTHKERKRKAHRCACGVQWCGVDYMVSERERRRVVAWWIENGGEMME